MTHSSLPSFRSLIGLLNPKKIDSSEILQSWHREGESGTWLSRSAWSLALLAQLRQNDIKVQKKISFWIPDYFCNGSLSLLRETGCNIIFYPLQENFEPDFAACKQLAVNTTAPDIFLIVHYFGKPVQLNRFVEFCSKHKSWLVEDAAHVLRPVKGIGESGDFVLYSPHKILPVPDGAALITRPNGPSVLNIGIIKEYLEKNNGIVKLSELVPQKNLLSKLTESSIFWIGKKLLQKIGIQNAEKESFIESKNTISNNITFSSPKISWISIKILSSIYHKFYDIALERERNQMLWDYYFDNISKIESKSVFPAYRPVNLNWSPYLASYQGTEENISKCYNKLKPKYFLPTTWPDLPPEVTLNQSRHPVAIALRNTHFFLPVHQSISNSHFKTVLSKLRNYKEVSDSKLVNAKWNRISKEEWHSLLVNNGTSNLMQSWSYGNAKEKVENWKVNRVVYYSGETIVAFAQVLEKKIAKLITVYRVNRGPLFLTDDFTIQKAVIKELLSIGNFTKRKILSVSFELTKTKENAVLLLKEKLIIPNLRGYSSFWIDLIPSVEYLRAKLNGKWRNMLVYSEKQDLEIESGTSKELVKWICDIHADNMKTKGFKGISPELLLSLSENGDDQNIVIVYKASKQEIPVATVCVACQGKAATYLIGWTSNEGRQMKANYLLLWEAVKDLKTRKINWFDLGGIDVEGTPGITGFKAGMNGMLYSMVPDGWKF
jgi:hypothetical protein